MRREVEVQGPLEVYAELRHRGALRVSVAEAGRAVVETDDPELRVEHVGGRLTLAPHRGAGPTEDESIETRLIVPPGTTLVADLGGTTLITRGALADVRVAAGSGAVRLDEVTGSTVVRAAAGFVTARRLGGPAHIKAGSGSIRLDELAAEAELVTGSGRIGVDRSRGDLRVKSGSGDVTINSSQAQLRMSTASGHVHVGRVRRGRARIDSVSGNVRLGIPTGVPVWADLRTTTGRVTSNLPPVGPPNGDQEHVELRASTISGDIHLEPTS